MGDDEAGGVERRLVSPRPDAHVSYPASEDQRPDALEVVGFEALGLGRGAAGEHPLVQALAVAPQRRLRGDVRACDVAVDRHAHLQQDLTHGFLSVGRLWRQTGLVCPFSSNGRRPRCHLPSSPANIAWQATIVIQQFKPGSMAAGTAQRPWQLHKDDDELSTPS